jgi:MarR family transcriptional regulator, transcriptional regulator for hemolysin
VKDCKIVATVNYSERIGRIFVRNMHADQPPVYQLLLSVTKRYLSELSVQTSELGLDRYQYVLVLVDDHRETLSQKALASLLQVDKSFIVTILDHLSSAGYVLREKNPGDRREHVIRLTDKARALIPGIRKAIGDLHNRSMDGLAEEEVFLFRTVLERIHRNLTLKT